MKHRLLILGMHRSGTSALAGACSLLGAKFGDDLVPAQQDNERGYFEDRRVLALHEELLAAVGSSWDDISARSVADFSPAAVDRFRLGVRQIVRSGPLAEELGAIKDPRLCRLLGLWLPLLEAEGLAPLVLVIYRDAREVASSLARRNGFSREKSDLLWVDHGLRAERASRSVPRAFVSFEKLLAEPVATLERAASDLGIEWPKSPASCRGELRSFVDPALNHARPKADDEPAAREGGGVAALTNALAELERAPQARPAALATASGELADAGAEIPALLVEHLLAVGRRELTTGLWSAGKDLETEVAANLERVSGGLAGTERELTALASRLEDLAQTLGQTSSDLSRALDERAEDDRRYRHSVDGGLEYLTDELAAQRESQATQLESLDHLRHSVNEALAKLARIETDVDLEARLIRLEQGDRHLSERLAAAEQAQEQVSTSLLWRVYRRLAGLWHRRD